MGNRIVLKNRSRWISLLLVVVLIVLVSHLYFKWFGGIKGDGIYYYCYAISLLEDGDFDLQNQFDHRLPSEEGQTVAGGNYFINKKTGKAFSLHNPGTGLFMIPLIVAGQIINRVFKLNHEDPYDPFYQKYAGYVSVLLTLLSSLFLFLILRKYYSFEISLGLPILFLFGTNWLFYTTVFADFSHACSLFCVSSMLYVVFRIKERFTFFAGALFGLIGGLGFTTRNFNLVLFGFLFLLFLYFHLKNSTAIFSKKNILAVIFVGLFFLVGAFPQLKANQTQHGNPLTFGYGAIEDSVRSPGFDVNPDFKATDSSNLYLLYTNLFNSENGLFYSHPLYLFGLLGLLFLRHKNREFQAVTNILLLALVIFWFIDASYFDNWFNRAAGSGFGHRRFISFLPLFIFGAANIFNKVLLKKSYKFIIGLSASLMLTVAVAYYHLYLKDFSTLYANRENFVLLYNVLLGKMGSILLFSMIFLFLIVLMWKKESTGHVLPQNVFILVTMVVVFILPSFLFRPNPQYQRHRHIGREGFFYLWSLNDLVQLKGEDWGMPANKSRLLYSKETELQLPAPLQNGDVIFFKIAPVNEGKQKVIFSVYAGEVFLGSRAIEEGKKIYQFELPKNPETKELLRLEVQTERSMPPYLRFFEGRVIYNEQNQPIKTYLDLVKIENDRIEVSGWCLDDHGISDVKLFFTSLGIEEPVFIGDIPRLPQSMAKRADVDHIFVLYPELDIASFKGYFPLTAKMSSSESLQFWVEVTSNDGEIRKSRIISLSLQKKRNDFLTLYIDMGK